ncbi:MAG: hypothetical protein ABWZ40_14250 [Caulobacterales bacterium]
MSKAYRDFHFAKVRDVVAPLGGNFPYWLEAAEEADFPADYLAAMAETAFCCIGNEFAEASPERLEELQEAIVVLRECCMAMEALESAE